MNVPTGQFATNKDIEVIKEHYDRITTYQIPVEQFEKRYCTDMPTEQLATKEELLELEKRLLVLEREPKEVKYRSERVTDKNSTSSYIAGV